MKRSHLHALRTGGACAALVAALGFAFACSESPTEATLDDLAPLFDHKGKPHGKPGGGGPTSTTVTYGLLTLAELAGLPGVHGDGGLYEALRQDCLADPLRSITLVPPVKMPEKIPGTMVDWPLPPVCPQPGRVSIHLPGDELNDDDSGNPGDYGANEPSFTTNKNGKVRPTGWMRPTFNLVWVCGDLEFCNFVWTDGFKVTTEDVGSRVVTITGGCARLYAGGLNIVPFEPDGDLGDLGDVGICDAGVRINDADEPVTVLGFEVAITVTVTEETQ